MLENVIDVNNTLKLLLLSIADLAILIACSRCYVGFYIILINIYKNNNFKS
jgi:hypothetical protein